MSATTLTKICQPERLFYKDGDNVFTEAVAATRARGETKSKDYGSSLELLLRFFGL
jgi:isochorismate synthase EntC